MDPLNSLLTKVWADAKPLNEFLEERAKRLFVGSRQGEKKLGGATLSTLEGLSRVMQENLDLKIARKKGETEILNDLVAGRLVGLGRPIDSLQIEEIDSAYWIGAEVQWIQNLARWKDNEKVQIRIVLPDVLESIRPKHQEGGGRPSERHLIMEAISEYAKRDPTLRRPPEERHAAYRKYLRAKGRDPEGPGFEPKTLEKYETEYRKKKK